MNLPVLSLFWQELIINLIVAIVAYLIGVIFSERVRRWARYRWASWFDKQINIQVELVSRYNRIASSFFDRKLFDRIRDEINSDNLSDAVVQPHYMEIRSENMGLNLVISLDVEGEMRDEHSDESSHDYYLRIKHNADFKSFKNTDDVRNFMNLAQKFAQVIRSYCFANNKPDETYSICQIKNLLRNMDTKRYSVEKPQGKISLSNRVITITTDEPEKIDVLVKQALRRHV